MRCTSSLRSCRPSVYHTEMGNPVKCLFQGHSKRTCRLLHTVTLMLNVKQGSCEYQFLSHRFDPTRNRIPSAPIQKQTLYPLGHQIGYTTIATKNQFTKKQQINENARIHNRNKITKRSKTKSDKLSRVTFTLKELPHKVLIRHKKNQCRKHRPRNASLMGSNNKSQGRWKVGAEVTLYFFQPPIEISSPPSASPFKNL